MTAFRITLIALSMFFLSGCTPRGPKNAAEAAGEYVFPAPTGDVEVLILNADSTYRQELFPNIDLYRSGGGVLYTNNGTWSHNRSVLSFDGWLGFFDYPNPGKRIDPPRRVAGASGQWNPPTGKVDAVILLSEEFHYAFLRVKNRADGAKMMDEVSRTKK